MTVWMCFEMDSRTARFVLLALGVLCCSQSCEAAYKPEFKLGSIVDVYAWLSTDSDPFLGKGTLFKEPPIVNFTVPFDWAMAVKPINLSVEIPRSVISRSAPLTRVMAEVKKPHKRNLIFDPLPPEGAVAAAQRVLPHFVPRMQAFVVIDQETYPELSQEYLSPFVLFFLNHLNAIDHKKKVYLPMLHFDELAVLSKDLIPLNESVTNLEFELKFQPLGLTRYEWMLKMEQSVQTHKQMGTPESEMEEVRRMFVETNSTLLAVTIVHGFESELTMGVRQAFKNDISFWSSLESTKGISVRSVAVQTCMEVVVLLYLLDNETSYLVLITVVGTIVINAWKLFKAWQLARDARKRKSEAPPRKAETSESVEFSQSDGNGGKARGKEDGKEMSEELNEQELSSKFDGLASKYLLLLLGPAIVGYAVYSLVYEKHKGWYSWMLESGVNVVYAVGFMMMTPQLFLNYQGDGGTVREGGREQYKSVDHLPWRALIYRALNTFIDDLFAFVITMPGLHRVAVFRDDVVFFIYLYQRWIYRTRRPPPGAVSGEKDKEQAEREALIKSARGKLDAKSRGKKAAS